MSDLIGNMQPFERTITKNEGSGQRWQIDPKDIRFYVEENLLGKRTEIFEEYIIKVNDDILAKFWSENTKNAKEIIKEYCKEKDIFISDVEYDKTGKSRKAITQVKDPLVNEVGAYHILAIIEGVFSRIGYMSNLSDNEINDIMYDDILTPLIITIMENHDKYGIQKGSRDEIVGFCVSTCMLILKSSRGGWTGNRFAQSVQEQIVTRPEKRGILKSFIG